MQTHRWREMDSNFQFLDLGRAFFTPFLILEPQALLSGVSSVVDVRLAAIPAPL